MNGMVQLMTMLLTLLSVVFPAYADEMTHDSQENMPTTLQATVGTDGVQHVAILGGSYFFKPNHVIVKANVPVELTLTAEPGMIPHNFILESDEAKISVRANISTTPQKIVFTPMAAGKYPFYCSKKLLFFESHRDKGMEGVLEVVE